MLVPEIPLPEQARIVEHLDRETGALDNLEARIRDAVDRLTEYRASLVSDAVTGRIDVRGGAG